jgi:hypothetical protein
MKMKPPRLRFLGRVGGLPIYLVSGEKVRNELDIDFTQGGNDGVYSFYIPAPEIWIDDALHGLDRTATALHEMVERDLMVHHGMESIQRTRSPHRTSAASARCSRAHT